MKREIEYTDVTIKFAVRTREVKRATQTEKSSDARGRLAEMLAGAIVGNDTMCLDAEEIVVTVDGKPEIGTDKA